VLGWAMLALLSAWGINGLADPRHQVSLSV
jgi:hypothetical protein